eukprot:UN05502
MTPMYFRITKNNQMLLLLTLMFYYYLLRQSMEYQVNNPLTYVAKFSIVYQLIYVL